ncbi:MAG TPA: GNAT family N-acetyltransferase [Segeticoccus sp.]|uniref:bifunctional acetate--CoA ligase family protein/GNAT family N-acetyltransferase n=1 Tax=Segeticoccus sp. TaxID=2706531 RepID=UPI002D808B9A|nr:GNAT family N-acetyltransferase [Segeticoccus sp.]HET8598904.1 GNAT family N-acetyltransferase [Segeticoccus sp.]
MTTPPDPTAESALPAGYPHQWEADVVLRDGSVAHVRPITPADAEAIHRFHARQSAESVYLRFFAPIRRLSDRDVERFTHVDYLQRVALVAEVKGEIIGIARYDRLDAPDTPAGRTAEVAFNISDAFHGRGLGSVLLEHLAAIASEAGVERFVADVLPQNRRMISVFADAGYEVTHRFDDGVITVSFQVKPTEQSQAVRMTREHRAESVSVGRLLTPRSVAVVGASRRERAIGARLLQHLVEGGFTGTVHAVNHDAEEVAGLPTVARVSDLGEPVDLAVIAVPAESVLDVVRDCAESGVRNLLVASAGFAEAGEEGQRRQAELLRTARLNGMRVVGPNSFGLINTDPAVRLNASLSPEFPQAGRLGLFAQSGALGIAVLASATRRGLGISVFASAGNRVDVSGNDLMQYWIDDAATDAVGLYLESMGNPRKFSRIARNLARTKPVIVIKSGVSSYGVPPGHRVRVSRARPEAFDAMLRQAGVIRVENVHQLFDVAQLVLHQPLPAGSRVGIVSNSEALGALSADAALSWGLEVSHGPVSVRSEATAEEFAAALDAAFDDPDVDSVATCFIPPVATQDEEVARVVARAADRGDKPCVATFLGMRGVTDALSGEASGEGARRRTVPAYGTPEDAVRALAAATRYGEWRARDHGTRVQPEGLDRDAAERIVDEVLAGSPAGRALQPDEARALLAAYGIPVWQSLPAGTADEAVAAAEQVGYPVVLKSVSPLLRHQAGLTGIRVDLRTEASVREAFEVMQERLAPLHADRFVVQRMATPGVACVVTTSEDPLFGPVLSFSIAGLPTELLDDVGYRIPPLTEVDVTELIGSVKAAPLLFGRKGSQPVDRDALADLVARASVLADDVPEVASMVLNPVNSHGGGVEVLGAEITIAPAPQRTDTARRALPDAGR